MSHFGLMLLYALLLGAFLATLWRRERREQLRLFLQVFVSLIGGSILLGWLMYLFPSGPPAPLP
ncbi:MAG: hypothetical protein K8I65_15325 [Thermoanaerobaculia bacterium]|nr:hypothetical protein [Thermoanaerobaculia bacterium]